MTTAPMEVAAAERLKTARRLAGMTQKEAAAALFVTERTYARWERAETAGFLSELERIAGVFGTTADALLGVDGTQAPADVSAQMAALQAEVAELRQLLLDPAALRAAADALAAETPKRPRARKKG
jgi:transcriptional regulator with XRE-family HTH domain